LWSNDGGVSWGPTLSTVGSFGGGIASPADGRCITVTNAGAVRIRQITFAPNWSVSFPPLLSMITSAAVAVAADGQRVMVANAGVNGEMYRSADGGLTWATSASILPAGWAAVGI